MKIHGSTVYFKSLHEMFTKEWWGIKPNTVRLLNIAEEMEIINHNILFIKIIDVDESKNHFIREINDISILRPVLDQKEYTLYVFSWIHPVTEI